MSDPEYIGRIARSIAPCGLVCALCGKPSCKGCRESTDAELSCLCRQRTCCREKGFSGCWECPLFPCGEGMFSSARSSSRRLTAFVRCVREDGADALASYLAANEAQGLLYHRDAVHFTGDYDISEDEAEILRLLREDPNHDSGRMARLILQRGVLNESTAVKRQPPCEGLYLHCAG